MKKQKTEAYINKFFPLVLLVGLSFWGVSLSAQVIALKNNLAADAFGSPNLSLEVKVGSHLTLDLNGHYFPFSSSTEIERRKYWLIQPELRLWRCEPFSGHFIGVHFLTGEYNIGASSLPFGLYRGTENARYEGSVVGGGLSYGYQWILSPHWGVEAELGGGYVRATYERYRCPHCGEKTGEGQKHYLGPTKVAISLVYVLK